MLSCLGVDPTGGRHTDKPQKHFVILFLLLLCDSISWDVEPTIKAFLGYLLRYPNFLKTINLLCSLDRKTNNSKLYLKMIRQSIVIVYAKLTWFCDEPWT